MVRLLKIKMVTSNLSILECKLTTQSLWQGISFLQIYPYWNVNTYSLISLLLFTLLQIYPYWNVNLICLLLFILNGKLQIYPYWNVNFFTVKRVDVKAILQIYPYWNVNRLKILYQTYC